LKKQKNAGWKSAETSPSRNASAAVAPREAFAFSRLHLRILLVLILAIAAGLRFYALPATPPGLFVDEAMDGANALEALETGHFSVFYPEDNGREGLYVNVAAPFVSVLGNQAWVLRVPAAIFGFLTVWGVYLLTTELLSECAGLLAAFFLATSFWHVNFSRIAFRAIASPLFLVFALYFLLVAYRTSREGRPYPLPAVAGGFLYGLGFYTYIAYRVTPLLVGVIVIACAVIGRKQEWFLKWLKAAGIFIFTAALVATPLAVYFIQHPRDFSARSTQVSVFAASNPVAQTLENIWKTALMTYVDGDSNWRHNYAHSPQIYWPVAILMTVGIVMAIRTIFKRTAAGFLPSLIALSWLILASVPAFLSNEGVPHALRAILMIPPAMMLAAMGAVTVYTALSTSVPKGALIAAAIAFLLWLPYQVADKYFVQWAQNPSVAMAFETWSQNFADQMNAVPRNVPSIVAITAPGVSDDRLSMQMVALRYLTRSCTKKEEDESNIHYYTPKTFNRPIPPELAGHDFCEQVIAAMPQAKVFCIK
jgi:4-amino-4-deoxy-L-arabinose transferase-like glycosyltransferase